MPNAARAPQQLKPSLHRTQSHCTHNLPAAPQDPCNFPENTQKKFHADNLWPGLQSRAKQARKRARVHALDRPLTAARRPWWRAELQALRRPERPVLYPRAARCAA